MKETMSTYPHMNHHPPQRSPRRRALRRAATALVLLIVGIFVGAHVPPPHAASGQVITPAPAPFKAGDQLALPILQEIAATLQQIDDRLARLEKTALQMQSKGTAVLP